MANLSRKTRQRGIMLSAAVGVSTLALSWLGSSASAHQVTHVVVAAATLSSGNPVTASDLTTQTFSGKVPKSYIENTKALIGKTVTHDVVPGQPILNEDVSSNPVRQGLNQDDVGIYVPVTLTSSAGVVTGDTVDVIWTGSSNSSNNSNGLSPGTTLLNGVTVINVITSSGTTVTPTKGSSTSTVSSYGSSVPAAVELAVPESQSGIMAEAAAAGTIWLALDPWGNTTSNAVDPNSTPITPPTSNTTSSFPSTTTSSNSSSTVPSSTDSSTVTSKVPTSYNTSGNQTTSITNKKS